jgi:hypothetical protein
VGGWGWGSKERICVRAACAHIRTAAPSVLRPSGALFIGIRSAGTPLPHTQNLDDNAPALALFASLGFVETKRVPVFSEVHMELAVAGDVAASLVGAAERLVRRSYDPES